MEQLEHKETQQPTEIVLEYRQPDYREVVEQYSYTLPKKKWLDMQLSEWEEWAELPKKPKQKMKEKKLVRVKMED